MSALSLFNILVEGTNSLQHLFEDRSSALILGNPPLNLSTMKRTNFSKKKFFVIQVHFLNKISIL